MRDHPARDHQHVPALYSFPTQEAPEPAEGDLFGDVERYLTGFRRRWPLILVLCLLFGGAALIRYSLTPKEYRSTATIQIERKRLSLVAMGQAGWIEDWWNQEYYPTQYRLLKSRGMAERVVTNLRLFEDPSFAGRASRTLADQGDPLDGANHFDDAAALASIASRLQGGLAVEPVEGTQLVELTYVSTSPELAARVANGYAEAFIEWGIETRNSAVGQASDFLSAQILSLRQEIEERQLRMNAFTTDLDIALDPAGEALLERRETLETQYNRVVAERISKEAAYRELLDLSDEMIANTASGGRVSELESSLVSLENEYQDRLETYRPEWPDMLELQGRIEKQREELERLVGENVDQVRNQAYSNFQKARREEGAIAEELRKLAEEARQYNSSALEYNNLRTLIDTRKELLNELLKRQSQTEVAARVQTSQESNVRIVDRAIMPGAAFRPTLEGSFTRALLLGFVLGAGIIVLLEYLDRTIKTPEELENLLGLPNLAVIPDVEASRRGRFRWPSARRDQATYGYGYGYSEPRASQAGSKKNRGKKSKDDGGMESIELLPHRNPRLAISEAYRTLRTSVLLSTAHRLEVVMLTSAMPGEGKTATTANLAVVMAQLGRRVLVIDADLRRSRQHEIFKVSNRVGLVNHLTGQIELERIFLETSIANLWICPAGPVPPNPSELLSSERMVDCLQLGRHQFDMVLIDTPPVLPVADTVILGPQVDGVLLCARAGMVLRQDARACRERLKYEEIKILGTVLNRYKASAGGRYDKRYHYYSSYYGRPEKPTARIEESSSAA